MRRQKSNFLVHSRAVKTCKISIKKKSGISLPEYASDLASGADVRAFLDEDLVLAPNERAIVPTGLFLEIPSGYEVQIRPRSGLCAKFGVTVLNTPGTIDADYRGEIKVILFNASKEEFVIEPGMRIAQMVVAPVVQAVFLEAEQELSETQRGSGGFGHTGLT